MKKLLALLFFFVLALDAYSQVVVNFDQMRKLTNVTLKMSVVDSKTEEAIPYASVYLIPDKDTTITYFALSDDKGKVEIKDVLPKKYEVNIEMIGYLPHKKVYDVSGYLLELGEIALEENPDKIDAASITAVGNAVTVLKDTIIYNASSFHVGANAMLEDLLKKMPGMEVAEDGTVKVNGEAVDKITVGGKTFFFKDPAMAVKNLPAKIVDKIKVIDKDTDLAAFTGVTSASEKEKVMDVELKEEYRQGWFGNAKLSGGAALVSDEDKAYNGHDRLLFNGNALLSGFNDTDQLVMLANGQNAKEPGANEYSFLSTSEYDELTTKSGVGTTAMAGANYNTSRIKGVEASANVVYNYNLKDVREKSYRTSFNEESSALASDSRFNGYGEDHKVGAALEMKSGENKDFMFSLRPSVSFQTKERRINNSSTMASEGVQKYSSQSLRTSSMNTFMSGAEFDFGFKKLGHPKRSVVFYADYDYQNNSGNSSDNSVTDFSSGTDSRNLRYDDSGSDFNLSGSVIYNEPLSEKFMLRFDVNANYQAIKSSKDAFNGADGSANDYYTSYSKYYDKKFNQRLNIQYSDGGFDLILGADIFEQQNTVHSKSYGNESRVGEKQWIFNYSPFVRVGNWGDKTSFSFVYSGRSRVPYGFDILPAMNLSNPVQLSIGNVYLRPEFMYSAFGSLRYNNRKNFSFINVYFNHSLSKDKKVYATWFDAAGVRYALPVNSHGLSTQNSLYLTYNKPVTRDRKLTLVMNVSGSQGLERGYQATSALAGLDKDAFDYASVMSSLWGNEAGDKFYDGSSGFSESKINSWSYTISPKLTYRLENFSASLSASANNNIYHYSLNPKANLNTWRFYGAADMLYTAGKGWEFGTDCNYTWYRGYADGYGDPVFLWNATVSKEIKSFTLSLKVSDILNQRRSLQRVVTEGYVQDTYTNLIGRYFLVGIAFNFGKMNAKQNERAQGAMWDMLF